MAANEALTNPLGDGESKEQDPFYQRFKYYKCKKPTPDYSQVIDFYRPENIKDIGYAYTTVPLGAHMDGLSHQQSMCGLIPPAEWKVYTLDELPGFSFIKNPFQPNLHRRILHRCIHDFPTNRNRCNKLYNDFNLDSIQENIWDDSFELMRNDPSLKMKKTLMYKLRWVTLGYHHNWDTKEYSPDDVTSFPSDLAQLSKYITNVLGYHTYSPQAAVVNYYRMYSTLAGHQDHSEYDMEAPLLSISFGQPAIFLLGGDTKDTAPAPMFLRDGDIIIMAGPARKFYHAVPKILNSKDMEALEVSNQEVGQKTLDKNLNKDEKNCTNCLQLEECLSNKTAELFESGDAKQIAGCDVDCAKTEIKNPPGTPGHNPKSVKDSTTPCVCNDEPCWNEATVSDADWVLFEDYLNETRVNLNVRQVFKPGETFPDQMAS
ncbi:unnamed protein product [Owenia fusiformis]|uniref:Alpha-ketoglutarate-dependent dioxygenase AlkB-like domain-containing protein n=1 Tax=Owenia fusiformis TaxID=6347 RepID=A0A8S4PD69_OWEFU|nr:unnamed protein product [Owenia fusiformis]